MDIEDTFNGSYLLITSSRACNGNIYTFGRPIQDGEYDGVFILL